MHGRWPSSKVRNGMLPAVLLVFSGCIFPAQESPGKFVDEQQATSASWPGVMLTGVMTRDSDGLHIAATSENSGSNTYQVQSICIPPWTESMTSERESVQHQEPRFYCQAFGLRDFPPGDKIHLNTDWNMTLWGDDDTTQDAPPGTYSWVLHFELFNDAEERGTIDLVFPVTVR